MKIAGKVALVTGGASGIGKAVSLTLLEKGAKLVTILDVDAKGGETVTSEFSCKFGADRVKFIECDLCQEDQLKNSFQEAYDVYGALDIVVNNAGILSRDNRKTVELNLMAVINGTFIAEKLMTREKRSEKGVIVNTASMGGLQPSTVSNASYVASKHGVVGFTRALSNSTDAFSKDLRVAAICPAGVDTNLLTTCTLKNEDFDKRVEIFRKGNNIVTMDMVMDAYIMVIEDDSLHCAIVKVTNTTGVKLVEF